MVHDLTANSDFQKTRGWGVLTRPIQDEKNMCDCCGSPIKIRPWDFEENKTLCPECEKWLEETHNSREDGRLLEEVVDDSFAVRVVKPWDIRDFERENAVDNVLLWD